MFPLLQPLLALFATLVTQAREALRAIDATRRDRVGLRAIGAFIWLDALNWRLATLVARLQSGQLPPLRLAGSASSPTLRSAPEIPRPRSKAWLARLLHETPLLVGEFESLLHHPDFQPAFAQEPGRFRRLLAPFCRALGIPLPAALAAPAQPPRFRPVIPPALLAKMTAFAAATTDEEALAVLLGYPPPPWLLDPPQKIG